MPTSWYCSIVLWVYLLSFRDMTTERTTDDGRTTANIAYPTLGGPAITPARRGLPACFVGLNSDGNMRIETDLCYHSMPVKPDFPQHNSTTVGHLELILPYSALHSDSLYINTMTHTEMYRTSFFFFFGFLAASVSAAFAIVITCNKQNGADPKEEWKLEIVHFIADPDKSSTVPIAPVSQQQRPVAYKCLSSEGRLRRRRQTVLLITFRFEFQWMKAKNGEILVLAGIPIPGSRLNSPITKAWIAKTGIGGTWPWIA